MVRQQGVQRLQRAFQIGDAVIGDGASVARFGRLIFIGVGAECFLKRIEEALELCHHPAVGGALRVRSSVRVAILSLHMVADEADALTRERVGARVTVLFG